MALKAYAQIPTGIGGVQVYKWSELENGDTGIPLRIPNYADKTFQVVGVMGAAGAVSIQGSNDLGVTFGNLHGSDLADLVLLGDEPGSPIENPLEVRPNVTAGDGTTLVDVWLVASTPR